MLVVPQIGGNIEIKKAKELEKIYETIEIAGKSYHFFYSDVYRKSIDSLIEGKFIVRNKKIVSNENIDGCVRVIQNKEGVNEYI